MHACRSVSVACRCRQAETRRRRGEIGSVHIGQFSCSGSPMASVGVKGLLSMIDEALFNTLYLVFISFYSAVNVIVNIDFSCYST